ncbi:related to Glucose oxidase [Ustilago sp. UG-2017a]|nr:related to Glucose oxidase [Ustilago sp. UG-2017a]
MKTTFITLLLVYLPIVSTASREPHRSRPSSHHHRRTRNFHADPYTPSTPTLYSRDSFGDQPRPLHRRSEPGAAIAKIYTAVTDEVFDYVIAGGGTAGLALAGRLSEDPDVTVAVIEAGHSGYNSDSELLVPSKAYFKSSVGSDLDWQYETALQSKLQDESGNALTASWPRGKVLGGSSAINGLYYVAVSKREHQVWGRLSGDVATWGWHSFRDAMKKSTDFSPNQIMELDSSIKNQTKYVGDNGPVGVTYPGVSYQPVAVWVPTLAALGAFIATSTINPKTWERSFSRNAYIDPIVNKRKNLVVLPNQTVTRTIWDTELNEDGKLRALGVEFAANSAAFRVHVTARGEVILSAELPGVGQNLQDHLAGSVTYTPADGLVLPSATNLTRKASFVDSSVAYITLEKMYGTNETANFIARAKKLSVDYIKSATNVPAAVRRGWAKQYKYLLEDLLVPTSKNGFTGSAKGAMEMLLGISTGSSITVEAALQAPFSRGWVEISSDNAFDKPIINPNYLQHQSDVELMRSGFQLARKIGQTAPLSSLVKAEAAPGAEVDSDEEWDKFVAKTVQTEYHSSSTCSMLDEGDGGVVDEELRVYGTSNVRVVDASVVPISLSSHLMSATYAIAETAAELIKSCLYDVVDECDWDGEGEDEEVSASADGAEEEDCEDEE